MAKKNKGFVWYAPSWALVLFLVVDTIIELVLALVVFGYFVALASGTTMSNGFQVNGWVNVVALVLTGLYFWVMYTFLGGTIGMHIFRFNKKFLKLRFRNGKPL